MIKQSLLSRKPKSDIASKFVGVTSFDKNGRPKTCIVPGSNGKQYQVILRRIGRTITTECRLIAGRNGYPTCPGNSRRKIKHQETICYHSRAAVVVSPRDERERSSIVAARFPGVDSKRIADHLGSRRVVISARGDIVRFSPHLYNEAADIERALDEIDRFFRSDAS